MHEKKNCIIYVICFELCRSLFSRRRRFLGPHRGVDQPNYMDVSNPDQAAGLVILIRPDTDVATANVQSLLKGQPFASPPPTSPSTISRRAAATPSKSRRRTTNTWSSGTARR